MRALTMQGLADKPSVSTVVCRAHETPQLDAGAVVVPTPSPAPAVRSLSLTLRATSGDAKNLLVSAITMCPALERLRLDFIFINNVQHALMTLNHPTNSQLRTLELHRLVITPMDSLALIQLLPPSVELLVIGAETMGFRESPDFVGLLADMAQHLGDTRALREIRVAVSDKPLHSRARDVLEAGIDKFADACAKHDIAMAVVPLREP